MARPLYSDDVKPNQMPDIILQDGTLAVGGAIIEPVGREPLNKAMLDELAFMEEEITVMVQETSDENAENPVTVGNNGVFKQFFRGVPTTAKRKFVDCLIVKTGRVTTPEIEVPGIRGGRERSFSIQQRSAHRFPFMVISDKNPRGAEWLTRRLSDAI